MLSNWARLSLSPSSACLCSVMSMRTVRHRVDCPPASGTATLLTRTNRALSRPVRIPRSHVRRSAPANTSVRCRESVTQSAGTTRS